MPIQAVTKSEKMPLDGEEKHQVGLITRKERGRGLQLNIAALLMRCICKAAHLKKRLFLEMTMPIGKVLLVR